MPDEGRQQESLCEATRGVARKTPSLPTSKGRYPKMKGHLCKRNGIWSAVIDLPRLEGRRKQKWVKLGALNKSQASEALRELLHKYETNHFIEPTKLSIGEFLDK